MLIWIMFPCLFISAQKIVELPKPAKDMETTLMYALQNRKSVRDFSAKDVPMQELSNLLWAANGVNREDGKRTAPSALNKQDIDIYVCMHRGAYKYNAQKHVLEHVTDKDLRAIVAMQQDFVKSAPVVLVLVSDLNKFGGKIEYGAMDAGYVSQNICLYCSAAGLITVPRASMDKEMLIKELNLTEGVRPIINHPIGYAK